MSDLVKRLHAHKAYNAFTDGPLVLEAAARITELEAENARLKAELLEAQKDEPSLLLIAHMDGADKGRAAGRAEALEEAAALIEDCVIGPHGPYEVRERLSHAIRALGEKAG